MTGKAAVVKLVDTPALGAGSRKGMRVRVSPAALEERARLACWQLEEKERQSDIA
jgi:hypothetical protein